MTQILPWLRAPKFAIKYSDLVVEVYADDANPAKAYYRLDWRQDGSKNIHMKTFRWWERILLILRLRIINHSNAA